MYDYEDLQVYTLVSAGGLPQQVLTNAASAEVSGFELEAIAQPTPELLLSFGAAYLDTEFKDFQSSAVVGAPLQDFTGNQLPFAPELSYNFAGSYTFDLMDNGELILGANVSYQDETFVEPANTNRLKTDDYTLLGLSAIWRPAGSNWELGIWGENVTDEEYINHVVGLADFGLDYVTYGEPATYGVSLRYSY